MKIRHIRLEGFKRFREPLTLADLVPGINLIAAPNGKGKSTIAEAVRVGFLERYRTSSLGDSLAPWTQPGANPTVQIEFEREGKTHRLAKTFGSKKSCTLEVEGGKTLNGDDAEQLLSDLFSFSYSGKGTSKPEHHGVPGLLWVQQGQSGEIASQVENAHEYISRALGDDLGELAATAGDRVIERVEAELAVLHTKGGKPTGDYARTIERHSTGSEELAELRAKIAAYERDVDQLARLKERHTVGERDRPWEAQRAEAAQAQEALRQLDQIVGQRREVQLKLTVSQNQIQQCQATLATYDDEDRAVADREAQVGAARESDQQTLEDVRAAEATLRSAQEADSQAREAAAAARRAATRRGHEEALAAARQRRADLGAQLIAVQSHTLELAEQQASESRLASFAEAGKKLLAAESKLASARATLEAVSTRIEYDLQGEGVSLEGDPISGSGNRTVAEPTEIVIAGIGSIRVLPGAKDLTQLRAETERAQLKLEQLLQAMGASTPEEARQRERALAAAKSAIERLQAVIGSIAPAGMEALREQANSAEGEEQRHEQALAALPKDDVSTQGLSVEAAEAREAITRKALQDAQAVHEAARGEAVKAKEQVRLADRELAAARARVAAPDREERRKKSRGELASAEALAQTQIEQIASLDDMIRQAQPELLRSDVDRLTQSADALEVDHGRTGAQLVQLAGQLQGQGALGLQEQAAALEEDLARVQRQIAERARRAAALVHLLKILADKRAEVARSIRAPLQQHMNRYLAIQFPGASLELDERLRPNRITRNGPFGMETGAFEALSGGEREQLGIIARLAYADLLKDAGKPTLVMLDDSLVNSDRENLAQMKRVIYDAAQRHQILIFTCHQENWLDLGVAPRSLQ